MKLVPFVALLVVGCGPPAKQAWTDTYQGTGEDAFLLDDDFVCLGDPTYEKVGATSVRIKNVLGHEADALAVANAELCAKAASSTAGTIDCQNAVQPAAYPPGTIIQLFPGEASVKRGAGFAPETDDWEFFTIDVGSGRSVITSRGTTEVHNVANTCVACHGPAKKDFDFACFTNNTCTPFPFFVSTHVDPNSDDPRCHPRF